MNHATHVVGMVIAIASLSLGGRMPSLARVAFAGDEQPITRTTESKGPKRANQEAVSQLITVALKEVPHVSEAKDRVNAYGEIAKIQTAIGDTTGAFRSLKLAEATAAEAKGAGHERLLGWTDVAVGKAYLDIARAEADAGNRATAHEAVKMAKASIAKCETEPIKLALYCRIADSQARVGDMTGARETIEVAKVIAAKRKGDEDACCTIAHTQAKIGDVADAKATAGALRDIKKKASVYLAVVGSQLEASDLLGAKTTTAEIEPEEYKAFAYVTIAEAQAQDVAGARETLEAAKATLAKIIDKSDDDNRDKWGIYGRIAATQVQIGDLDKAVATAAQIEDEIWRWKAYCQIAAKQAKLGDAAGARKNLEKLKATAPKGKDDTDGVIDSGYGYIADAQALAGDFAGAKETATQIEGKWVKLSTYTSIVWEQLDARDFAGAKETASRLVDESYRGDAYYKIAVALAVSGDVAASKATLTQVGDGALKAGVYRAIARAQMKAGDAAGASETLEKAKSCAAQIEPRTMERVYYYVAMAQSKAGDVTAAIELIADTTDVPRQRCEWLVRLGEELCETRADATLSKAGQHQ